MSLNGINFDDDYKNLKSKQDNKTAGQSPQDGRKISISFRNNEVNLNASQVQNNAQSSGDISALLSKRGSADSTSNISVQKQSASTKKDTYVSNGENQADSSTEVHSSSYQKTADTKKTSSKTKDEEIQQKISPEDYTVEGLKKQYPPDRYNVIDNHGQITVTDKATGKKILKVFNEKGFTYIDEFDEKGKSKLFSKYDKNGNLYSYRVNNGEEVFPLVETLYADICAKNSFGLPTTGKDILKHIKQITPENVVEILEAYKKKGETLEEAINSEWGLDKKVKEQILAHIKKCLEEHYGFDKNYKNDNSRVTNEYYQGANYSVVQKGDVIEITNKDTGKKSRIDFNKLLKGADIKQAVELKSIIQKLPGEVLEDMAAECTNINAEGGFLTNWLFKTFSTGFMGAAGYYSTFDDKISLNSYDPTVIVHELGHAIDNRNILKYSTQSEEFKKVFEEEMKAYEAAGNQRHDGTYRAVPNYCTTNEKEMFAECYTMLMFGKPSSSSGELILQYFPKTLEMCKKILQETRNRPPEERH